MPKEPVLAPLGILLLAVLWVGFLPSTTSAVQTGPGAPATRPVDVSRPLTAPQSVQSNRAEPEPAPGIVFVDVTPDSITKVKTAPNVITRIALPELAKEAFCGDVFDATTNTGTFVINNSDKDVFIKPLAAKGQTNLFVKTESGTVYNFDLTVVTVPEAHRVVNVNLPTYAEQIQQMKSVAMREIADERTRLEAALQQDLDERRAELDKEYKDRLEADRKQIRADANRRAGELATRRLVDGIIQGLNGVALRERRGQLGSVDLSLDDMAYVFEGKLHVRYRISNQSSRDLTYREPRIQVTRPGNDSGRRIESAVQTARGDLVAPAGQTVAGVAIFERPALDRDERLVFTFRVEGSDRELQLRILEP